ncbi:MAG: PLP-dependent cysteine synthase family protein [Christensenellales bacterium]
MKSQLLEKFSNLSPLICNTPLLEVHFLYNGKHRRIFAKAESYNLTGSIKDRVAFHIMKRAYEDGLIEEGDTLAEATSGNTGISFAAIGSYLGNRVVIFMPDYMSKERISLIKSYGGEVRLVSKEEGGFLGSIQKTCELASCVKTFLPCQFSNEENTRAHYMTTGSEILTQLESIGLRPDAVVAGVGTGGTIMGVGKKLRESNPACRVYPLEPSNSRTLSTGHKQGNHRIQGISDEFVPRILKLGELDEILAVDDGDAINMARMISRQLGFGAGISSGANFLGTVLAQETMGEDSVVVTVFADDNKKYLSTDYCREQPVGSGAVSPHISLLSMKAHR